ncbi:MAG: hypothetical protein KGJ37_07530, partial [Verrucomicrobiota bacterium]|nr:hypothetical protein [Verrucomicrobiota bacterium]
MPDARIQSDLCWRGFIGSRSAVMAGGCLIALAVFLAYANSFHGPFIFDDPLCILHNKTIRSLLTGLFPPTGTGLTVSGRPMVNLSLAVNYALSGTEVRGYHITNLCIHIMATLALFGLVRRTLQQPRSAGRYSKNSATALACAIALIWGLHPLQTESVTYVIQRAESLAALFYLLTLYCFVRYSDRQEAMGERREAEGRNDLASGFWLLTSVLCCLIGMASKETMVSAPIIVFLY